MHKHPKGQCRAHGCVPKGAAADHWTWRGGEPHITGFHRIDRRTRDVPEPDPAPRNRGTLFERMAKAQRLEPVAVSKNTGPSKRKLRELASPKPRSRAKELRSRQGSLL